MTFSTTTTSGSSQSVKYSNTDIITNLNNIAAIDLPIFGALSLNDNITLYDVSNATSVAITESGRYEIIVHILLLQRPEMLDRIQKYDWK